MIVMSLKCVCDVAASSNSKENGGLPLDYEVASRSECTARSRCSFRNSVAGDANALQSPQGPLLIDCSKS